jgi:hypothetical protein
MKAGRPQSYLKAEESVTFKPKFICECSTNVIRKSIDNLCPSCGAEMTPAEEFMAKQKANFSPKVKTSRQYDDVGREITPKVPEKKRSFTYTEQDMIDKAKNKKKKKR